MIALVMCCVFYCNISIAQKIDCTKDSSMYLAAYNYIINDSINTEKTISVSDSIVDLDRFWFSDKLIALPVEKEKLDRYRTDKKYSWFNTFYSACIDSLFYKRKEQSDHVLFFSTIEDNMLRADLLSYKKSIDAFNYDQVASQTEAYIYLFIFNTDGTIKEAFGHEIIYD